ncbi:transposase [Erwinia pyrifoliae]|uniref:Uncharacterized protein n=1 Tax=Erwinia pyrifoliae TaxID=79967 RepID=A0ABY5XDW5_ERWPY|nr:transposase [Erwinia pyrifoliae]MCA8878313.1 hypothetical protein [Erwinia pyrifoliae]MCT2388841.1 hypothetical protein [Erwinia pyrifoliae]MCU8589018.1 hypothetical protein [Erwinia pyrifoliae]UWS35514.1 hypothetical protein NYP84_19325 [Erwinia pyrifoliae]UXK14334.1 hypothetical protein NYP80_19485 [Erwinia pyrifoliae]
MPLLLAADICRSIGVSREQLRLRIRWCSDSFAFRGDNGEKLRVTFAQDCCDRVNGQRLPVVMIKRRCRMAVQNLVMAFSDYNVHYSHSALVIMLATRIDTQEIIAHRQERKSV